MSLQWTAQGGFSDHNQVTDTTHFECAYLIAGETHIPFSFELPLAPITYHGDNLNITWSVKVFAFLPWSLGMSHEEKLLVLPGPTARAHHEYGFKPKVTQTKTGLLLVFGLILAIPGAYYAYTSTGQQSYIIGGGLIGTGLFFILVDIWNLLASTTVGNVHVSLEPNTLKGGDAVEVTASFIPRRSRDINGIRFRLSATESVVRKVRDSNNYTKKVTVRSVVHTEDQVITGPIKLRRGHLQTFTQSFVLPKDAPPSFQADTNRLEWQVKVSIDIPWGPDWMDFYDLLVEPRCQPRIADALE